MNSMENLGEMCLMISNRHLTWSQRRSYWTTYCAAIVLEALTDWACAGIYSSAIQFVDLHVNQFFFLQKIILFFFSELPINNINGPSNWQSHHLFADVNAVSRVKFRWSWMIKSIILEITHDNLFQIILREISECDVRPNETTHNCSIRVRISACI